jgi:hypothetical protein
MLPACTAVKASKLASLTRPSGVVTASLTFINERPADVGYKHYHSLIGLLVQTAASFHYRPQVVKESVLIAYLNCD